MRKRASLVVSLVFAAPALLVWVPAPVAAAYLRVAGGRAGPGDLVRVGVDFVGEGAEASSMSIDIGFAQVASVEANAAGRPDCKLQAGIDKEGTVFSYLPPGCDVGVDCSGLRAVVLGIFNVAPLPDGRILTCNVRIAADAVPGTSYGIDVLDATVADALGRETSVTEGSIDGRIDVLGLAPCPSDCDRDRELSIAELVAAVAVAGGGEPLDSCRAADIDGDGVVESAEIVQGALTALRGCPDGGATSAAR